MIYNFVKILFMSTFALLCFAAVGKHCESDKECNGYHQFCDASHLCACTKNYSSFGAYCVNSKAAITGISTSCFVAFVVIMSIFCYLWSQRWKSYFESVHRGELRYQGRERTSDLPRTFFPIYNRHLRKLFQPNRQQHYPENWHRYIFKSNSSSTSTSGAGTSSSGEDSAIVVRDTFQVDRHGYQVPRYQSINRDDNAEQSDE